MIFPTRESCTQVKRHLSQGSFKLSDSEHLSILNANSTLVFIRTQNEKDWSTMLASKSSAGVALRGEFDDTIAHRWQSRWMWDPPSQTLREVQNRGQLRKCGKTEQTYIIKCQFSMFNLSSYGLNLTSGKIIFCALCGKNPPK